MKKLLSFLPALLLTTTFIQASDQTQEIQEHKPITKKFNNPQTQQRSIEQQNLPSSRIIREKPQKVEESGISHEESQQPKKILPKKKNPFQKGQEAQEITTNQQSTSQEKERFFGMFESSQRQEEQRPFESESVNRLSSQLNAANQEIDGIKRELQQIGRFTREQTQQNDLVTREVVRNTATNSQTYNLVKGIVEGQSERLNNAIDGIKGQQNIIQEQVNESLEKNNEFLGTFNQIILNQNNKIASLKESQEEANTLLRQIRQSFNQQNEKLEGLETAQNTNEGKLNNVLTLLNEKDQQINHLTTLVTQLLEQSAIGLADLGKIKQSVEVLGSQQQESFHEEEEEQQSSLQKPQQKVEEVLETQQTTEPVAENQSQQQVETQENQQETIVTQEQTLQPTEQQPKSSAKKSQGKRK